MEKNNIHLAILRVQSLQGVAKVHEIVITVEEVEGPMG